jgi:hypothetical protein
MSESEVSLPHDPSSPESSDPVARFDQAMSRDDFGTAWHVAGSNLGPKEGRTADNPWVDRESQAFEAFAQRMFITDVPEDRDQRVRHQAEAEALFGSARFRKDGLGSENPSIGAIYAAEGMVRTDLAIPGREGFAIQTAEQAGPSFAHRIPEVKREAKDLRTARARAELGAKIAEHPVTRAASGIATQVGSFEHAYLHAMHVAFRDPLIRATRRIFGGPKGSSIGRK